MVAIEFPDPESANEDGIVGIGGNLEPSTLIQSYSSGIFPWPIEVSGHGSVLAWFCPEKRAILELSKFRISKSLKKSIKSADKNLVFTIDQAFDHVIDACAKIRRFDENKKLQGTWITDEMRAAYKNIFRLGMAHSVECWKQTEDDEAVLVAGLYGTAIRGVFAGESMFSKYDDGSKMCVAHLVEHLKSRGASFIDIQMMTPHFQRMGAVEIPRSEFLARLKKEQERGLNLF